jgi:hypothetical protein
MSVLFRVYFILWSAIFSIAHGKKKRDHPDDFIGDFVEHFMEYHGCKSVQEIVQGGTQCENCANSTSKLSPEESEEVSILEKKPIKCLLASKGAGFPIIAAFDWGCKLFKKRGKVK